MGKSLTGRKVLFITLSAFGVIIAVNLVMAFQAVSTFPGLEVKNSYVASQTFDADRTAQEGLGWTVTPEYSEGTLSLIIRDKAGLPARVAALDVLVGRVTHVREDQRPKLSYEGGMFSAPVTLAPGNWLIHLDARAADGTRFRQRLDFVVKG
ncbi:nitrogen fixation protein FixH [Rhodobacter veldkampii DSM 11550]|uniref:Nitrogen fixation protein FixH n=1 Tax=Phaeovulum veldkampii DSM 11550 TaxID=1185920 RepID=A0A2T4JJX7_9RHOB|nr:FixH family protein [Phaeovulum veldkampii]MBK5946078.1 nitrogen fixation protein FixH [Phaeovulum veldkampii DSM 11550]PTE18178.1 nitrogen fixation protein FixH [Phaeovulum veldkampii DSM 11550]TDQ63522.1 nitrogen fixation protein FixH [Phaeovulum veldkampii DSM 11550]